MQPRQSLQEWHHTGLPLLPLVHYYCCCMDMQLWQCPTFLNTPAVIPAAVGRWRHAQPL